jgi:hypothetical protein
MNSHQQTEQTSAEGRISLVTVAGKTHINRDYTRICAASWDRVSEVSRPWYLVSDGLRKEDVCLAQEMGFEVLERQPEAVHEALSDKPALRHIRESLPTWRHVIDSLILFSHSDRVLLIDTDVFVLEPVAFDDAGFDFMYNCDDIPGYRGYPLLPFCEPMVPAINPGFFLMNPQVIDLGELEELVAKYFIHSKRYWWTRQAALSVVVARSERRALFDGNDVRVLSGNRKRTREEVLNNHWKLWGDNRPIASAEAMGELLDGAAVAHLAGRGKEWLHLAQERQKSAGGPRTLHGLPAPTSTMVERSLIALRMFAIQVGRRRASPEYKPSIAMGSFDIAPAKVAAG